MGRYALERVGAGISCMGDTGTATLIVASPHWQMMGYDATLCILGGFDLTSLKWSPVIVVFVATVALASNLGAQTVVPQVIATGLDNPRGVSFAPNGALYVAEAGSGGSGPCTQNPTDPDAERCYGPSGAITVIDLRKGSVTRVATGLPSISVDGSGSTGVHDVAFLGSRAYFTVGYGGDPAHRSAGAFAAVGARFARTGVLLPNGRWSLDADLGAYEAAADPNGDGPDANPYSLLSLPGRQIVVDAGANALLEVAANGTISTLATFADRLAAAPPFLGLPPGAQIPMDAVPTSVAVGPDGAFYVGQLTGFPFPVGGANVYRVPAGGGVPEVYAEGFTNIIDLAWDENGVLYVLELSRNGLLTNDLTGRLVRVEGGEQTEIVVEGGLFAPGGIAIGDDGSIYVTVGSVIPGGGQVLRLEL